MYINISAILATIYSILCTVIVIIVIKSIWNRRWLLYYGWKMEASWTWNLKIAALLTLGKRKVYSLLLLRSETKTKALKLTPPPILTKSLKKYNFNNSSTTCCGLGSLILNGLGQQKNHLIFPDINNIVNEMLEKTPPVFAAWFGTDLVIFDSKPGHVEVLLNSCMEKSLMYSFISEAFRDGLLTSPAAIWRGHRKLINPTFNLSVLSSFVDNFAKHSNILVQNLENYHAPFDVLPKLLRCTLDIMCETLADVDASSISGQDDFVRVLTRAEELVGFRLFRVWLYPNFFWKLSNAGKEWSLLVSESFDFTKQVLEVKQMEQTLPDGIKKRQFLNHILDLNQNCIFNEQEVLEELYTHLAAGTDTTAVAASSVVITLGMYKDVQAKVYQELDSIFESSTRDPTLQDLNQMVYLENVIKETMRLLPPVPFVARFVDQDIEIEKQVFPKGCTLAVPIGHMNRMEEFWEDPLTFNPDRFLKESTKSQHRCTFIPFSFGARNCIGFKHATLSLKVVLSTIIRSFKVDCLDYKSTEDVKLSFGVTAKAINGYRIQLERRQNQ